MRKKNFRESQRFTQWWLWVLILGIGAMLFYVQANLGPIILIAISVLFLVIRLETRIDNKGIAYRFFPFVSKKYHWKDITSARVVDYGFVGGWGIRLFTSYGTIYNIRGSKGLAVELQDGTKFCLGTQRPGELQNVINNLSSTK